MGYCVGPWNNKVFDPHKRQAIDMEVSDNEAVSKEGDPDQEGQPTVNAPTAEQGGTQAPPAGPKALQQFTIPQAADDAPPTAQPTIAQLPAVGAAAAATPQATQPQPTIAQLPLPLGVLTRSRGVTLITSEEAKQMDLGNAVICKLSNNYMIILQQKVEIEEMFMQMATGSWPEIDNHQYREMDIDAIFLMEEEFKQGMRAYEQRIGDAMKSGQFEECWAAAVASDPGKLTTAQEALGGPQQDKWMIAMVEVCNNFVSWRA